MSIRALVVDDTVIFRRVVSDALASLPGVEVIGTAANGKLALSRVATLQPDLITLDIEMPEMNGIEVLERIGSAASKTGVIVLSALTVRGGELTVKALELGAFDFLTKPEGGNPQHNVALLRDSLLPIVQAFERQQRSRNLTQTRLLRGAPTRPIAAPSSSTSTKLPKLSGPPMVLIGVSTGGPIALASVLPAIPAGFGAPIFIVQHMPPLFTQPLAASLAAKCHIAVKEASDGECARPGCAYLAPGGQQMKLTRGTRGEIIIRITNDPPENNCKPAVDYLFRSAALQFPGRSIAVVLTGMGNDGALGLRLLKRNACVAIAQDEATSVVFGMPKEAIQTGVVDIVAPLSAIAGTIVRAVGEVRV